MVANSHQLQLKLFLRLFVVSTTTTAVLDGIFVIVSFSPSFLFVVRVFFFLYCIVYSVYTKTYINQIISAFVSLKTTSPLLTIQQAREESTQQQLLLLLLQHT